MSICAYVYPTLRQASPEATCDLCKASQCWPAFHATAQLATDALWASLEGSDGSHGHACSICAPKENTHA
jgi:hypothetical protein